MAKKANNARLSTGVDNDGKSYIYQYLMMKSVQRRDDLNIFIRMLSEKLSVSHEQDSFAPTGEAEH
jgi:hypothetical protein